MKLPTKCPCCNAVFEQDRQAFLMVRTSLDFDSDDDSRIEDQIFECGKCHALFRARYELVDFKLLKEMPLGAHDVEEFYRE